MDKEGHTIKEELVYTFFEHKSHQYFPIKVTLVGFYLVQICGLKYSNIHDNGDADIILHIHEIWGYQ